MPASNPWHETRFPWEMLHRIELEVAFAYQGEPRFGCNATVAHPFFTWWLVLNGDVQVETQVSGRQSIRAGEWVLIPVGQRRRQLFSQDAEIVSVNFVARWQEGMPLVSLPAPLVGKAESPPSLMRDAMECSRLIQEEDATSYPPLQELHLTLSGAFRIHASLSKFTSELFPYVCEHGGSIASPVTSDRRLEMALASLRNAVKAGPLPYERWERELGIGRAQLDRLAATHLRTTLSQYRNQLLVRRAYQSLALLLPVKQIALDLGFVDSSHFCRFIRTHTGRTPAEIRTGMT